MQSKSFTFVPRIGRHILSWTLIGLAASGVLFLLCLPGSDMSSWSKVVIPIATMVPLSVSLGYLRYLLWASRAIQVLPDGLTNVMRSGRAYSVLWAEVNYAKHETLGHQSSWTIKTSTGHRVYLTEEGLSGKEWDALCDLIRQHIPAGAL